MDYRSERMKIDIRDAHTRLKEAKTNLEEGIKLGRIEVDKAHMEVARINCLMEKDVMRLRQEVERAEIGITRIESFLQESQESRAVGFEAAARKPADF